MFAYLVATFEPNSCLIRTAGKSSGSLAPSKNFVIAFGPSLDALTVKVGINSAANCAYSSENARFSGRVIGDQAAPARLSFGL